MALDTDMFSNLRAEKRELLLQFPNEFSLFFIKNMGVILQKGPCLWELFSSAALTKIKKSTAFDFKPQRHPRQQGLYQLQPPKATDIKSVSLTNCILARPTNTFFLCSNVLVGPTNIKLVNQTNLILVASGKPYCRGL
jgi:hypothetical protein